MSGLQVGEQWWDTRRTETGGVGPRNDGVRRPNSGYQALISPLKAQQDKVIAHPSNELTGFTRPNRATTALPRSRHYSRVRGRRPRRTNPPPLTRTIRS